MEIYEFAKLNLVEKLEKIKNEAMFIEHYESDDLKICVYFFSNFFIEITFKNDLMMDIIPYKRGYCFNKMKAHQAQKENLYLCLN